MEAIKNNHNRIFPVKIAEILLISFVFMFLFDVSFFAFPALAEEEIENAQIQEDHFFVQLIKTEKQYQAPDNYLPENGDRPVKNITYRVVTAYNSEEAQCDSTPCITANGFNVCDHGVEDTIAANFLKFGTKVRMPDYFGEKVFIVRDRMNQRFPNRVDIWMKNKADAKKFGKKFVKIEIVE